MTRNRFDGRRLYSTRNLQSRSVILDIGPFSATKNLAGGHKALECGASWKVTREWNPDRYGGGLPIEAEPRGKGCNVHNETCSGPEGEHAARAVVI